MFWDVLLCCVFLFVVMLIALLYAVTVNNSNVNSNDEEEEEEKQFLDPVTNVWEPFPSLEDKATLHLSVIVPAYNEEKRLPVMLDECINYLKTLRNVRSEVIIVSDGSQDHTVEVAQSYTSKYGPEIVRVLKLVKNRGKGGAVRMGMKCARGAVLLFADADGATKFSDLNLLLDSMKSVTKGFLKNIQEVEEQLVIVCGSRSHLEENVIAKRSVFRNLLMHAFHGMVWAFTVRKVWDTQCGFKLLTRSAARICFSSLHVQGWAFDVELLYIAETLGIPLKEVAVNWKEVEGSKIVPVLSWMQMGRDVFLIWLRYRCGVWKIPEKYMSNQR